MKKRYIAPTMEAVEIGMNLILCVSGTLDPNQTVTTTDEVGAPENNWYDWQF